jgi:hypothetical protein
MTVVDPHEFAKLWESFVAAVIPAEAPEIQRREMKMAFYGGAHGLLSLISMIMDAGDDVTDADMARMESINGELEAFCLGIASTIPVMGRA